MKCCAGSALFGPGSLGNGRLSETLRPLFTRRVAATRLAGVIRFMAPFSSSFPQRPQLRGARIQDVASWSVGSGRCGMGLLRRSYARLGRRGLTQTRLAFRQRLARRPRDVLRLAPRFGAHGSIRPTMKITDVHLTLFAW